MIVLNGETFFADIGTGNYDARYWGPDRSEVFCVSSRGHSLPIIDGFYQKTGREYGVNNMSYYSGEKHDEIKIDIGGAYGIDYLKSLEREFKVHKNDFIIELTDRFNFLQKPNIITERIITPYNPEIYANHILIKGEKSVVKIEYDGSLFTVSVSEEFNASVSFTGKIVYLLDFTATEPFYQTVFAVRITKG